MELVQTLSSGQALLMEKNLGYKGPGVVKARVGLQLESLYKQKQPWGFTALESLLLSAFPPDATLSPSRRALQTVVLLTQNFSMLVARPGLMTDQSRKIL